MMVEAVIVVAIASFVLVVLVLSLSKGGGTGLMLVPFIIMAAVFFFGFDSIFETKDMENETITIGEECVQELLDKNYDAEAAEQLCAIRTRNI